MFASLLVFCLVAGVFAQSPGLGSCPKVTTVSSFDVNQYVGIWYEQNRSIPIVFELFGKCVTANYSALESGTIKVVNRQISTITGHASSIEGEAKIDASKCGNDTTGCAKLSVYFPIPVVGKVKGSYWVLDTDYTSYSVVWSCTSYGLAHTKFLWILTRDANPDQSVLDKAENVIKKNQLQSTLMSKTDQKNCTYN